LTGSATQTLLKQKCGFNASGISSRWATGSRRTPFVTVSHYFVDLAVVYDSLSRELELSSKYDNE